MKNNITNTMKYAGIVTISQLIGSKKIKIAQVHNEGGKPLFNFISECLVGNYDTAKLSRPTKIMLLKRTIDAANQTYYYEKASSFVYLRTSPEKIYNSSKGVVRYSFILPKDALADSTFNGIGLYPDYLKDNMEDLSSDDLANFSAFCTVTLDGNKVSSSAVLVVDWDLTISN